VLDLKFGQPRPPTRRCLIRVLLWTAFINGLLASLISSLVITQSQLAGSNILALVYLVLQQVGHFQFFSFLLSIPLVFITLLLPHKRFIQTLAVIAFSIFITMVFIDYAVFKLYRFHLNGMVWNMLTGGALEEIFVFDRSNILTASGFIAAVLLLQITLQFFLGRRSDDNKKHYGWRVLLWVLLIQFSGQSLYAWADAWYRTDIMGMLRFVPLAQPITIKSFLHKKGWAPDINQRPQIKANASGHFQYPLNPLQCKAPTNKPNILFIISDGLRFDMLNPEVMPNWSRLAQQSQQFSHHISTGNATRFGIFGLFSGLYGNYWLDALNSESSSILIDELKQQNYRFGFFSNARLSSPEFDKTIFSSIRSLIPTKTPGKTVIEREYEINRQAIDFFKRANNQPFFSLIFYDAPHAYVSPEQDNIFQPALKELNYLRLNNATDPTPFLNRYKNAVHFDDRLSGDIFAELNKQGLMENTIIIMTGDHGQEANETRTNSWGHNSNFSRYQVQVPMVIYWPGMKPKTWTQLSSHADVVPTLLQSVFSCENPISDYSNGQSLFDSRQRDFVLVKNWSNQAMVNTREVRVYPKIGPVQSHDFSDYKTLEQDYFSAQDANRLIESISRFYR
jgi:membrane-anchored protein YejM (alkaline phosphatase superfamily)